VVRFPLEVAVILAVSVLVRTLVLLTFIVAYVLIAEIISSAIRIVKELK